HETRSVRSMPLMEYSCAKCSTRFEILVGVSQDAEEAVCPECGSNGVEKLFSSFSAKVAQSNGSCGTECPEIGACGTSTCPCAN
ncbi:MAG: zinc ribbon domain-containing protein, partial [Candidatus Omnitrophica bacterium]|nr:zinc ribbon domain-containing protein [Candidatus Omnitrophota bacterium]